MVNDKTFAMHEETNEAKVHSFDFGPPAPVFEDKLEERQYVKERLALAYRILAREGMCGSRAV
jgi:hypothetical protein